MWRDSNCGDENWLVRSVFRGHEKKERARENENENGEEI
jgi:hypothetical protein